MSNNISSNFFLSDLLRALRNGFHSLSSKSSASKGGYCSAHLYYQTSIVIIIFCCRHPAFRNWLQSQGKTKATIKETINYAKKYGHILDAGDASPLLTLSPRNKHHAMTALANLAKYTGRYDQFLQIGQRYSLNRTNVLLLSTIQLCTNIFHGGIAVSIDFFLCHGNS
jgi:hypothetical protein